MAWLPGWAALPPVRSPGTEQGSWTVYNAVTKLPEKIDLPGGKAGLANGESHLTLVNDKTGETTSGWCTNMGLMDASGKPTGGAGYCSIFYDNGDVLWVSFTGTGPDQPTPWTVMGGTGTYAGATGSGMTTPVSQRGDGYASTTKSTGSITTK